VQHLTAEDIYAKIKEEFPSLSLATVYSILEIFRRAELIGEIRINFDKFCFDIRTDLHHHFLCRQSGEIFDVDIPCVLF